jgi:predicted nucleic acid-binding protein
VEKKLKIYLDTSVISYLDQRDSPEHMRDTLKLWTRIKSGEFDVVLSDIDFIEIEKCSEPKRSVLNAFIAQIEYTLVNVDDNISKVADSILDFGILRQKSYDDCQHIAAALVTGCDAILSWNFKHIINHKTVEGVKTIATLKGYSDLQVYTPHFLLSGGNSDDTL